MTDSAAMSCPICRVPLVMSERQGVEIDYCPQCRGVWLDRGELDKIIERNAQDSAPRAAQPAPDPNYGAWLRSQLQPPPSSGRSPPEEAEIVSRGAVRLGSGRVTDPFIVARGGGRPGRRRSPRAGGRRARSRGPRAAQEGAVRLEPARRAGARQQAVGDDDVGLGAGADHLVPAHELRRAGDEDPPAAPAAVDVGGAQVRAAGGGRQALELEDIRARRRTARPGCRGHSRRRSAGAGPARRSGVRRTRWRPSPVTMRSGAGVASAQAAPSTTGTRPSRRQRVRHRQIHRPPAAIRAKAARGIAGSRATAPGRAGGGVGEPEQQGERLPGQPPERRAETDQVEQQGQRLERHDDEGGERDGDDVGGGAIEAGPVEMEQRDRHQGELDGKAGEEEAEQEAPGLGRPSPRRGARAGPGCVDARAARRSR